MAEINFEGRYSVKGHGGVAFYLVGWEQKWEPMIAILTDDDGNDYEYELELEGEWIDDEEGRVRAVMVGDDHEWLVDPSDLTPIADEDYCSGCGQIGCAWG